MKHGGLSRLPVAYRRQAVNSAVNSCGIASRVSSSVASTIWLRASSRVSRSGRRPTRWRSHWSLFFSISTSMFLAPGRSLSRCASRVSMAVPLPFRPPSSGLSSSICFRVLCAASRYSSSASSMISGCPASCDNNGICCVSPAQKESMVWILIRAGFCASCQLSSRSLARACAASLERAFATASSSLPLSAPPGSPVFNASIILLRITAAALRVKVMATISSGASTTASSRR